MIDDKIRRKTALLFRCFEASKLGGLPLKKQIFDEKWSE